jgi:hypothetical protein
VLAETIANHPLRLKADYAIGAHLDFKHDPKRFPYYEQVPKGLKENGLFRERLLDQASRDGDFARELWEMCAQDILFYVNSFVWTYDPRRVKDGQETVIPFVTWPFQDWVLGEIQAAMGKVDLNIHKSRDLGASWMVLAGLDHSWRFDARPLSFLLVSAKEDLVDWKDNPDTLFAKLDFIDKYLPDFLQPRKGVERFGFHRKNQDTGSVFNGSPSIATVGMAGRRTAIYMDEFAAFPKGEDVAALGATQKATECRIWTSTPKGEGTAQAGLRKTKAVKTIAIHWTEHPGLVRGLYRGTEGKLEVLDSDYAFEPAYNFRLDGKWRSPYRDREDDRISVDWMTDQELDLSYQSESRPFFDGPQLDRLMLACRPPVFRGFLDFSEETLVPRGTTPHATGPLRMWVRPERLPSSPGRWVIGCDISAGTAGKYASNSVASVWDTHSRQKVAEFVANNQTPEDFSRTCIALGRWFGAGYARQDGAVLIWEINGPGGSFAKKVVEYEYGAIYYKRDEEDVRKRQTSTPGFWPTRRNKTVAFGEYRRGLFAGEAINPCKEALEEARCYRYIDSMESGVVWGGSGPGIDRFETGANHGDRVVADMLAWKLVSESQSFKPKGVEGVDEPEKNTLAWRHKEAVRESDELAHSWY